MTEYYSMCRSRDSILGGEIKEKDVYGEGAFCLSGISIALLKILQSEEQYVHLETF